MRRPLLKPLLPAVLAAVSATALAHDDAAAWRAAQRVQAAEETLSARYTTIWRTLDPTQKTAFSARERAWLNGGRQAEQRACVAHAGADSAVIARSCDAAVLERHVAALAEDERLSAATY